MMDEKQQLEFLNNAIHNAFLEIGFTKEKDVYVNESKSLRLRYNPNLGLSMVFRQLMSLGKGMAEVSDMINSMVNRPEHMSDDKNQK